MNFFVLLVLLMLAQVANAGLLSPEEVEEVNARMRAMNQGEAAIAPAPETASTIGAINSEIRARADAARGKTPQIVDFERKQQALDIEQPNTNNADEESQPKKTHFSGLKTVDVNTASEAELANVASIGSDVAAQITQERNARSFSGWSDLVHRVVGLSAAQTAFYASVSGLTVDGKSLDGAPPNATMEADIREKYQSRRAQ